MRKGLVHGFVHDPAVKIHCSVLAEDAIKMAINDYRQKQGLEPIEDNKKHY